MGYIGKKLRISGNNVLTFYCNACKTTHGVRICRNGWQWNENPESPTFTPSLLSVSGSLRCHCFVSNGCIKYLNDSTHELKGKSVPMLDLPYEIKEDINRTPIEGDLIVSFD